MLGVSLGDVYILLLGKKQEREREIGGRRRGVVRLSGSKKVGGILFTVRTSRVPIHTGKKSGTGQSRARCLSYA